ncbi:MAG: hypothetical protein AAGB51_13520 [Planctomycetota bacterium]
MSRSQCITDEHKHYASLFSIYRARYTWDVSFRWTISSFTSATIAVGGFAAARSAPPSMRDALDQPLVLVMFAVLFFGCLLQWLWQTYHGQRASRNKELMFEAERRAWPIADQAMLERLDSPRGPLHGRFRGSSSRAIPHVLGVIPLTIAILVALVFASGEAST